MRNIFIGLLLLFFCCERVFAGISVDAKVSADSGLTQAVSRSLTVISFSDVDMSKPIGATASNGASSGAQSVSRAGSIVVGVDDDFDNAIARVLISGQSLVHQFLSPVADTYRDLQEEVNSTISGTVVSLKGSPPTSNHFNMAGSEILAPAAAPSPSPSPKPPSLSPVESIFTTQTPAALSDSDGTNVNYELGMKFSANVSGQVTAIRFYKSPSESGTHTGKIYSLAGTLLVSVVFSNETASGWQQQSLDSAVSITPNTTFVVSVNTGNTFYVDSISGFASAFTNGNLTAPMAAGVYGAVGSMPTSSFQNTNYFRDIVFVTGSPSPSPSPSPASSPTPTPSPSPISTGCGGAKNTPGGPDPYGGCFPGPNNTGVPGGTNLTTYTGSCSIRTDNLVIDSMTINCSILNYAQNVTIRNSVLNGTFMNNSTTATATVQDTTVDAGSAWQGAFEGANINLLRVNVSGGEHSVHCYSDCSVRDSYLHDQFNGAALGWHQNGFLSNGGSNFTVVHNSVGCIGGCTGDITFINDDSMSHATVDKNLLLASPTASFCAYPAGGAVSKSGISSYMVWTDNVLQRGANRRCSYYGPVYEWKAQTGNPNQDGYMNVWSGNIWDDGAPVGRNTRLK